jgi:glycosyltransferase involved in cell wall biosynthesis
MADLFYFGENHKTTVRSDGIMELESLKSRYRVNIPERRLSQGEFYEACARALITWSPEGAGWDCFRHYEALACGSVPLINYPTITRYAPLVGGRHCLFYSPENGGMTAVIEEALKDRQKLIEMAREGRDFVFKHHTQKRIVEYMIEETMKEYERQRENVR